MQYYVYEHKRKDNGEVFYIGQAKKPRKDKILGYRTMYSRAFAVARRPPYWKKIGLTVDYWINIVFETDDIELAYLKEIELIKLHGRSITNEGPLVNRSSGGQRGDAPVFRNIRITQYNLDGSEVKVWDQVKDIQNSMGYLKTNVVKCCRKKQLTAYGFKWSYTDNREFDSIYPSARRKEGRRCAGIVVYDSLSGNLYVYRTQQETANKLNLNVSTVLRYLKGTSKHKTLSFSYQTPKQ